MSDLNVLPEVAAIEAINAGDMEAATNAVNQLATEARMVKDFLVTSVSMAFTYIADKNGEEAVLDAWKYVSSFTWAPLLQAMKGMTHEQRVGTFAAVHSGLGSGFSIEEDDEKTVIYVSRCGSGGKMMKDGLYDNTDRTPVSGGTTKKCYPWSCNQKGMPYYCVHAPVWYQIMPKEMDLDILDYEFGRQYDDDGNEVDEPCKISIYKQPRS